MKRFEYLVIAVTTDTYLSRRAGLDRYTMIEEQLNKLGKDGWELVGVNALSYAFFKRELIDKPLDPSLEAGTDVPAEGN